MEGTWASLTALSFSSECMASISEVGLNRRPATEVVRFRIAFSGLHGLIQLNSISQIKCMIPNLGVVELAARRVARS